MNFELSIEDFTIIQNALHYYKSTQKRGNFMTFNERRINALRDNLSRQLLRQESEQ